MARKAKSAMPAPATIFPEDPEVLEAPTPLDRETASIREKHLAHARKVNSGDLHANRSEDDDCRFYEVRTQHPDATVSIIRLTSGGEFDVGLRAIREFPSRALLVDFIRANFWTGEEETYLWKAVSPTGYPGWGWGRGYIKFPSRGSRVSSTSSTSVYTPTAVEPHTYEVPAATSAVVAGSGFGGEMMAVVLKLVADNATLHEQIRSGNGGHVAAPGAPVTQSPPTPASPPPSPMQSARDVFSMIREAQELGREASKLSGEPKPAATAAPVVVQEADDGIRVREIGPVRMVTKDGESVDLVTAAIMNSDKLADMAKEAMKMFVKGRDERAEAQRKEQEEAIARLEKLEFLQRQHVALMERKLMLEKGILPPDSTGQMPEEPPPVSNGKSEDPAQAISAHQMIQEMGVESEPAKQ